MITQKDQKDKDEVSYKVQQNRNDLSEYKKRFQAQYCSVVHKAQQNMKLQQKNKEIINKICNELQNRLNMKIDSNNLSKQQIDKLYSFFYLIRNKDPQGELSKRSKYIKQRKQKKVRYLKGQIERVKKCLNQAKKQEQILKQINSQYYIQQKLMEKNAADPQQMLKNQLIRKNQALSKQINNQKQIKTQIFLRVLKIYKNNWKSYFIKKFYQLSSTHKVFPIKTKMDDGSQFLKLIQQKQILFKTKNMDEEDGIELIDDNVQQEDKMKIGDVILRNIHFLHIFHKILLPQVTLPYKIFIAGNKIYLDNLSLTKDQIKDQLNSDKTLSILGKFQANLQIICSVIGHQQVPFMIFQQKILTTFKKNNYKLCGYNSPKKQNRYLKELVVQRMISLKNQTLYQDKNINKLNNLKEQVSENQSIPSLRNEKSDVPSYNSDQRLQNKSKSASKLNDDDDDDQEFQILQ